MPFCPKCRDEFQDWVKECPDCKVALVEKLEPVEKPELPERVKSIPTPSQNLVTIASFSYPTEAYLASAILEAEGIWSFVADEHIITVDWRLTNAIGGVKVQVSEADAQRAREVLLEEPQNTHETTTELEKCPKCNSTYIQYEKYNLRLIFGLWFASSLFLASPGNEWGLVLPFFKRKWKCKTCGFQWKSKN